ncbi:unnamed protein product [Oppiella nova]|uniref:Uncharacterized protein n=1 Tax=Oppiella nova TaxID=334625 RepID=A0A7R9M9M9_9ACAR|nr:unnamed protein product [Oppiella nova]CAG2173239.1 unnamed protein product [Oppiella nova]
MLLKQAHGSFHKLLRDTLVDFPHLTPDSSRLTVISSPKYYANNELFKLFNTFKLEAKALEVSEQTLKIESIQQLIDRQDIDVMVLKKNIIDRLLKDRYKELIPRIQYVDYQDFEASIRVRH